MKAPSPTLVVLAAGLSTRYGRLKQLEAVGPSGEALMDFGIFDAWRSGVRRVVLVVRPEIEREVVEHVRSLVAGAMDVVSVTQTPGDLPAGLELPGGRTKPWGTAHAVWSSREAVGTDVFLVMNSDDFYGSAAFERLIAWARSAPPDREVALLPWRLDSTLSAQGGVSRGICRFDRRGELRAIEEVLDIREDRETGHTGGTEGTEGTDGTGRAVPTALRGHDAAGRAVRLTGEELCSLNLWGFTPAIHDVIARGLTRFLSGHGREPGAEYFVPDAVQTALEAGEISVRLLAAGDVHLGMTHPEDRAVVEAELRRRVADGGYPAALAPAFRRGG